MWWSVDSGDRVRVFVRVCDRLDRRTRTPPPRRPKFDRKLTTRVVVGGRGHVCLLMRATADVCLLQWVDACAYCCWLIALSI